MFPDEHGRIASHRKDWPGVPERAVMGLMGWSTTAMAARYQHMVDAVRTEVAKQVDGLIWKPGTDGPDDGAAGVLVPVN